MGDSEMLIVIVGARGAGKTTLLQRLSGAGVTVLKPSTTRKRRFRAEAEYDFVRTWDSSRYQWEIDVGAEKFGMRRAEIARAMDEVCVTVFDPLSLATFEAVRDTLGMDVMTVGLATIADLPEQHRRVGGDAKRIMTPEEFDEAAKVVAECDVVMFGGESAIASAMLELIRLLGSRGGVVTKDFLLPLIDAGVMLHGADRANVRAASYDLRLGSELLCQGQEYTLDARQPRFEIPPYSYAIVSAQEMASLPPFVIARFDLKVSMFFEGVILSNGPQVDPGYKGALFCMLYNGSGRPRLLTLGEHFATIDFTITTSMTEGYRQKYQFKQKMSQFVTREAIQGKGGAIVELIDQKVGIVGRRIRNIQVSFWAIAAATIAVVVVGPAIVVPMGWNLVTDLREERAALTEHRKAIAAEHQRATALLEEAKRERQAAQRLLLRADQGRGKSEPSTAREE